MSRDGVGVGCLVRVSCVEIVVLLRVSRIMLAKPAKMVATMARERIPPVSVLNSPSPSNRSSSVE